MIFLCELQCNASKLAKKSEGSGKMQLKLLSSLLLPELSGI
jgi:hypothetical protein